MIIDSHQHFWKYDPVRDAWINESMSVIRRDFYPTDLEPILKANNIDGCVAVQADQSEDETRFLLDFANQYDFIKGVVGWVDLLDKGVEGRLEYFADDKLLKGIRHVVQAEPDPEFMLRKDFQEGIGRLAKFGLTYDILVYPHQLAAAIELTRKFPNQKFVLDHIAKPQVSKGMDSLWRRNIEALAKASNVYCKLSGMVTETKDFLWAENQFYPFMEVVLESFGTDRVLYGSDWPVCLVAGTYEDVLTIVSNFIQQLSPTEQKNIMGLNAVRFYEL
ncbi:amidohydrolase family protein [Flagellimonas onchidii]|uniref:amidohydrolase family protein n=1 Tax=Flagellimonas onchidii TaxID=2562684 RepID=UPI0010A6049F|nr:amidohydrolase family protein [Allomuricauda onchidii]